jgi:Icc protein
VLTGDVSQDFSEAAYLTAAKSLANFQCPIYWLPGNHDVPDVMYKTFANTSLKEDKAILLGNWLLILLNSHYPKHVEGLLGRGELSKLEYYLSQHPTQHTLVFLHHHPVLVGSKWLDKSILQNPDQLFEVIDRYPQVKGIVCGHVHQVFETERRGVPIISAPSTCIQFLPGSEDFALDSKNPGYRWFELNADGTFQSGVERLVNFVNTSDFTSKGY